MAKFIGKWSSDHRKALNNFDEFAKAAGMPQDAIEKLKTATSTVEFYKDGDKWIAKAESSISQPSIYPWTPGVQEVTTDIFGKGFRYMSKFDSDSKMTVKEEAEIMDWKTVITTREVIADKMITTKTLPDGTRMSQESTRC